LQSNHPEKAQRLEIASKESLKKDRPVAKPRQDSKGIWPVTYRWVAAGTLIAYTALGAQRVTFAQAQQTPSQTKANPPQTQTPPRNSSINGSASQPTHHFEIAAGLLEDVLPAFETASGLHVVITNAGIGKLQSPGVHGEYTNDQAIEHLLEGAGVTYRFAGPDLVRLELSSIQQSVTVNAADLQFDQVDSAKYTAPLLDTPQSISVVPQQIMAEQNTSTLRDALRNVAGISLAAGEGSSQGDNLTIRGFTARNDIFLDGIRDFGSYYRDTFNQEEVQVLEGPSAATFGRGTTGGVINEVSKYPEMTRFIQGNATFGSDLTRRINADINEPLPQLGSGAAFRLNLMGDDNKVADRDVAEYRRYGFAPSLGFGLDGPTRVVISYFHQSEDDTPDYGIPWYFNGPAPVATNNYYGFSDANLLRTNDDIVTAKVEHDFNGAVTLRNTLRYANEARNAQITEPQIPICAMPPSAGCVTPSTPLSAIMINRNEINVDSTETMFDDQLDATFKFHTGAIKHTVVTGLEGVRETSDPTRNTITGVPTTSLLNPNESQPYAGTLTPSSNVHVSATTLGVYALDTIELGSKFDLIGGGRWDRFDASYNQSIAPVAAFTQIVSLPSWRGAFVYKPRTNGSIYFDAGNSFNPSAESLSLSAANFNTPPEKSLTYEVGTKWDLASGKFSINGSLFRTDKTNAREPDPNNPLQNVLGGNQRVQGMQIGLSGYLTDRWELLSSYALLDGTVVSSVFYPRSVGEPLANVPRNTFDFWSTYRLPWKNFKVGAGGNFVDKRTASSTVPFDPTTGVLKEVPGYWVFNALASYPLSERTSGQLNVNNLSNKYYYDQIHPAHIVPGAGFTALIGVNFKF
jgi:catecholate siderophore receptor